MAGIREQQAEFWHMVSRLVVYSKDVLNKPITIIEWMRSEQQQAINVARGASKTMNSLHLKGLAVDVIFLDDILDDGTLNYTPDDYKEIGEFWESMGGVWGGRFGDKPDTAKIEGWDAGHFQAGTHA